MPSVKYKTLEGNPKLCVFGEFIDESDGHVNRLEGSGLLDVRTELDQFNSGYRLSKNDGARAHRHPLHAPHATAASSRPTATTPCPAPPGHHLATTTGGRPRAGVTSGNREHFKISRAINLQPAQMVRLCALDLGSACRDDGSGRNLGFAGRNVFVSSFKLGAKLEAESTSISAYDYQERINKSFVARRVSNPSDAPNLTPTLTLTLTLTLILTLNPHPHPQPNPITLTLTTTLTPTPTLTPTSTLTPTPTLTPIPTQSAALIRSSPRRRPLASRLRRSATASCRTRRTSSSSARRFAAPSPPRMCSISSSRRSRPTPRPWPTRLTPPSLAVRPKRRRRRRSAYYLQAHYLQLTTY